MPIKEFRKSFRETIDLLQKDIYELTLKQNNSFYQLLRVYFSFIHERTQTLFFLVQNDCLWDADIILRPIAECTVKFVYLSSFDEENRLKKVREFWEYLAEINKLKQSNQAKKAIDLTDIDSESLRDLILTESEHEELSQKWTKKIRQSKEQPWSYNEMIKTISTNSNSEEILCLARNFTQSSHLIHADETGLGVILDRKNRTPEKKEALIKLHEIRLLSDCVSFYFWICKISSKLSNEKVKQEVIDKLIEFENRKIVFKPLEDIIR